VTAQPARTQRITAEQAAGPVEVTAARGSGDDAIVAAVAAAGGTRRVLVVTADRELAARAVAAGAGAVGPSWLLRLLDQRPLPRG
jgi:rRNA-processing protein FCF1